MHSANFTALSRAVSFLSAPVPELLARPVSEGAFEPQPALITPIRATITKAASGRSVLLMLAPWCVEIGLTPVLCRSVLITAGLPARLPMHRGTSLPRPGTPECSEHP